MWGRSLGAGQAGAVSVKLVHLCFKIHLKKGRNSTLQMNGRLVEMQCNTWQPCLRCIILFLHTWVGVKVLRRLCSFIKVLKIISLVEKAEFSLNASFNARLSCIAEETCIGLGAIAAFVCPSACSARKLWGDPLLKTRSCLCWLQTKFCVYISHVCLNLSSLTNVCRQSDDLKQIDSCKAVLLFVPVFTGGCKIGISLTSSQTLSSVGVLSVIAKAAV